VVAAYAGKPAGLRLLPLAVIEVFEEEKSAARQRHTGEMIMGGCAILCGRNKRIGDVRGLARWWLRAVYRRVRLMPSAAKVAHWRRQGADPACRAGSVRANVIRILGRLPRPVILGSQAVMDIIAAVSPKLRCNAVQLSG